jgi:AraC-like DNA-binding protein
MQIAELEQRLEKQRREQALQMLERDQRMQKVWNNMVIAGFFTVLAGLLTFYKHQRHRHRKNLTALHGEIDNLKEQHKKLTEQLITTEDTTYESQNQRLVQTAVQIVYDHLSDPQFGVEKLADMMGMSRANLHRKLKLASGFPPGDLIRHVRLKRAAQLLKHQTDTVTQVGFTVGFEDQSYFSKCFKKQFGMSPSEYSRSIVPVSAALETNLPAIDT